MLERLFNKFRGKKAESQSYLYANTNFPCLIKPSAELEELPQVIDGDWTAYYRVNARNALRHLTYGTSLLKGSSFSWDNLKLLGLDFKALMLERDPQLLAALRLEMKLLFEEAYRVCESCDSKAQDRLEIFINTLLSNFPFMDPVEGELVKIPQRINNTWREVEYQFKKIDISPKTGWWSWLLEEEDRIYAYGLEPVNDEEANPHLLLMGTTYFSGQGSTLSLLGDLTPGQSVGERHDLGDLEEWIRRQKDLRVTGHSQGGTMAMIVAAKYPKYIKEASCLNPAALHQATLDRLTPHWLESRRRNPEIKVYTQTGDPVFIFGDGFLPGTRIFRIDCPESAKASMLAAHAHHYSGHASAEIRELIDYQAEVNTNKRKFFSDMKAVADRIMSPLLSLNFIYFLAKRKILRFCSQHAAELQAIIFATAIALCLVLMLNGVLAPAGLALAFPLLKGLAPAMMYGILGVGTLLASALTTYLLPKLTSLAINITQAAMSLAVASVVAVVFALSGIIAGFAALKRACFDTEPAVLTQMTSLGEDSTQLALASFKPLPEPVVEQKFELIIRSNNEVRLSSLSLLAASKPQGPITANDDQSSVDALFASGLLNHSQP